MNIRRILCATDFSVSADRALDQAVDLGCVLRTRIDLIHVYHRAVSTSLGDAIEPLRSSHVEIQRHLQEQLDLVIARYADRDVTMRGLLSEGAAWERIIVMATETKADMIVIGRNGRSGLSQLFVGSTAVRVVKNAPMPVLTVRA